MIVPLVSALALTVQPAGATGPACDNQVAHSDFTVCFSDAVSEDAALWVAHRVDALRALVQAYLQDADTYAGAPYDTPLIVYIDPDRFSPYQLGSAIHLPEARVLNAVENRPDSRQDLGIVHELTHVFAASAFRDNRDRFYDDGLAVFLQHRFGDKPNYPDFGEDLYVATARAMRAHGALIPLSEAEAVRGSGQDRTARRLAYLQEGAFTQYLIERFGLNAYFRIYQGAAVQGVTGVSLAQIEQDWRGLIETVAGTLADD